MTFSGHKVSMLEDLKRGGARNIHFEEAPPPKCTDHDEQMKIFCFDCNRLICRDCTVIDHNGHNLNFLKKCAPESRKTLCDSLAPLIQANIAGAEKKLNVTEAQVDAQKNEVRKSLGQSFESSPRSAKDGTCEESQRTGPGEEGCSGSSEEGAASGPGRNPEPG